MGACRDEAETGEDTETGEEAEAGEETETGEEAETGEETETGEEAETGTDAGTGSEPDAGSVPGDDTAASPDIENNQDTSEPRPDAFLDSASDGAGEDASTGAAPIRADVRNGAPHPAENGVPARSPGAGGDGGQARHALPSHTP